MAKPKPLPKRFQPFLAQAQTETALRYGGQESALGSLLASLSHDYGQQAQAQHDAGQSVLGALKGADGNLQQVYTDAGLTPALLGQIANSPTGQRLAGELASGRAGIQGQLLGAQAGQQYIQQHLADQYGQDTGKVRDQVNSLEAEKGLYGSSLLDTLIRTDRSTRHAANVALAAQNHADKEAILQRQSAQDNALIGQGLLPGKDGTLQPLPGGKADPNAPQNQPKKPKRTTGPGTASPDAQRTAGTQFSGAVANAQGMLNGKPHDAEHIAAVVNNLTSGRPASGGGVIYDQVPVMQYGKPVLNPDGSPKMQQVPRLEPAKLPDGSPNPKSGQRKTTAPSPAIPPVPRPIAQAVVEQTAYGYVTTATVRALQKLGYSVKQIPGLVTQNQHAAVTPASPTTQRTNPNKSGSIRDIFG